MLGLKKQLWDMYLSVADKIAEQDPKIIVDSSKSEKFDMVFDRLYEKVKLNYMAPQVMYLDRHKVAAITIISLINSEPLSYSQPLINKQFWGGYKLAISVGFSYLLSMLNNDLTQKNYPITLDKLIMPEVFMEDIPYTDVLARSIHFISLQCSADLCVMDLAEKLFLLEQSTLIKYNIPLHILKKEEGM